MATNGKKANGANGRSLPIEAHERSKFAGFVDPIVANKLQQALVANASSMSRMFGRYLADPRRSIEDECGFPNLDEQVSVSLYQQLFDRNPIAARAVEVLAKESWQVTPQVFEKEDSKNDTPFEEDWDAIGKTLSGDDGLYEDEEGSPIWEYCLRADVLSGVGSFAAILLGFNDGITMSMPVAGVNEQNSIAGGKDELKGVFNKSVPRYSLTVNAEKTKGMQLTHMRVFGEYLARVVQYEANPTSPRFGKPVMYLITLNDPRERHSGVGLAASTYMVHWTRIVHVADVVHQAGSSEVFACPRLQPILNNVLGLHKLYGAGPEGYWKACFNILSYETHPQLGGDVDVDVSALQDMNEEMMNGLQRSLYTTGMSVKSIAPTIVDPTSQINSQIEAICIKLGCPVRVFKGSERGELASSQDDAAWNDRLKQRQRGYITPRIVVPLVNRLIQVGVLTKPAKGFSVHWPDLTSQTQQEKATVAAAYTQALAGYVGGSVENLMQPHDYLTRIIGLTEEEADAIMQRTEAAQEAEMEEQQAQADEHGMVPTPPPGFANAEPEPAPQTVAPIKVKEGEKLVHPDSVKPPTPTGNEDDSESVDDSDDEVINAFCSTGEGGGVDPSCGKDESVKGAESARAIMKEAKQKHEDAKKQLDELKAKHEATKGEHEAAKEELRGHYEKARERATEALGKHDEAILESRTEGHDYVAYSTDATHPAHKAFAESMTAFENAATDHYSNSDDMTHRERMDSLRTIQAAAKDAHSKMTKLKHDDRDENMQQTDVDDAKKYVPAMVKKVDEAIKAAKEHRDARKSMKSIREIARNQLYTQGTESAVWNSYFAEAEVDADA